MAKLEVDFVITKESENWLRSSRVKKDIKKRRTPEVKAFLKEAEEAAAPSEEARLQRAIRHPDEIVE